MVKISNTSLLMAMKTIFISPKKLDFDDKVCNKKRDLHGQDYLKEKKRRKRRWIFQKPLPYHVTTIQHHVHVHVHVPRSSTTLGEYLLNVSSSPEEDDLEYPQHQAIPFTYASPLPTEFVQVTENVQHHAAIVLQTAYRRYLARRALAALKGIVKLQAIIRGENVRTQAKTTLNGIQALIRLQNQICTQRKNLLYERSLDSHFNSLNCIPDSDTVGLLLKKINGKNLEDVEEDEEYLTKKIHKLLQNTEELLQDVKTTLIIPSPNRKEIWSSDKHQTSDVKQGESAGSFCRKNNKQRAPIVRTSYGEKQDTKIVKNDTFRERPSSYKASSPLKTEHHGSISIKPRKTQVDSANNGSLKEKRSYSAPQTPTAGLRLFQKVENNVPARKKCITKETVIFHG